MTALGMGIKTVQCKTGRSLQGCVVWNACSKNRDTQARRDYRGQVDYFGVWFPEQDKVYLVPVGVVAVTKGDFVWRPPGTVSSPGSG